MINSVVSRRETLLVSFHWPALVQRYRTARIGFKLSDRRPSPHSSVRRSCVYRETIRAFIPPRASCLRSRARDNFERDESFHRIIELLRSLFTRCVLAGHLRSVFSMARRGGCLINSPLIEQNYAFTCIISLSK